MHVPKLDLKNEEEIVTRKQLYNSHDNRKYNTEQNLISREFPRGPHFVATERY